MTARIADVQPPHVVPVSHRLHQIGSGCLVFDVKESNHTQKQNVVFGDGAVLTLREDDPAHPIYYFGYSEALLILRAQEINDRR